MKDLDLSISKKGIETLANLIGQNFVSMKHAKLKGRNIVFEKIEISTSTNRYLIDNCVDWFDNYFSGPEDMLFLNFIELNEEDNPFITWSKDSTEIEIINERIEDILIVQDEADVYNDDVYCQHIKSSEGIIFVTDKAQYGFFKDTMWLDEHVVIIKDKENALSKAESLKEHYNIFGYPFSGKCKRSLISLKENSTKVLDTAEEEGEIVNKEKS